MSEKSPAEQAARLASLLEMLADDPDSAFLRYGVAMQLKGLGQREAALSEFQRLLREAANYVPAYYHHAALLGELGRESDALDVARAGVARAEAQGNAHAAAELRDLVAEFDA